MNAITKGLKRQRGNKIFVWRNQLVFAAHELHDGGWIFSQKRGLTGN